MIRPSGWTKQTDQPALIERPFDFAFHPRPVNLQHQVDQSLHGDQGQQTAKAVRDIKVGFRQPDPDADDADGDRGAKVGARASNWRPGRSRR